jgi:hypothetical protein
MRTYNKKPHSINESWLNWKQNLQILTQKEILGSHTLMAKFYVKTFTSQEKKNDANFEEKKANTSS